MSLQKKSALITGSSRGIGRGIALKLAEKGARVAVHYFQNEAAAKATLTKIRESGASGFVVQADVRRPEEIRRMFERVKAEFGALDIFVSNARTEAPTFYQPPMELSLESWDTAMHSQVKACLVGVRVAGRGLDADEAPGKAVRHRQCCRFALLGRSQLDYRSSAGSGRRRRPDERAYSFGNPTGGPKSGRRSLNAARRVR